MTNKENILKAFRKRDEAYYTFYKLTREIEDEEKRIRIFNAGLAYVNADRELVFTVKPT